MIQLQGLTPLQVKLCDKIWSMDTQEEIVAWFDTLPYRMKIQAHAMIYMIMAELLDQEEFTEEDLASVRNILEQYR
jgi:hypothetical protein